MTANNTPSRNQSLETNTKKENYLGYGHCLIRGREESTCTFNSKNPYLFEAISLRDMLYTVPEIKEGIHRLFPQPHLPLVLEVGCYFGHTLVELALQNQDINFLGIDIKYKRVVKSCRKIINKKLINAKIALGDVQDLLNVLPSQSLYGICIFFPDPWLKNRHERYRYLDKEFIKTVTTILSSHGFLWIKTDHKKYYEEILSIIPGHPLKFINHFPEKLYQKDCKTIFESIFERQGIPVYQLIAQKNI